MSNIPDEAWHAAHDVLSGLTVESAPYTLKRALEHSINVYGADYKFMVNPNSRGAPVPEAIIKFKNEDVVAIVNGNWSEVRSHAGLKNDAIPGPDSKSIYLYRNKYMLKYLYTRAVIRTIDDFVTEQRGIRDK